MSQCSARRLIVSAINFSEGGPLTVLREFLAAASETLPAHWEIVALVHDRRLVDAPRVRFMEFPDSKRSWLRRLYYEFWRFRKLSRELQPDVWLSLHDISPRVVARRQMVYCHQPAPFYRMPLRELPQDPRFFLFTRFYRYLYRLNIHSNDLVIVQQDWIRAEFRQTYGVRNVAVAYPVSRQPAPPPRAGAVERANVFLYPALPRSFKNFTVLCEAAELLHRRIGSEFEVRLTVAGNENAHAAALHRRYAGSPVVKFIGRQNPEQMLYQYQEAGTIVFPSLLETWGLPISEAKAREKMLLLADLPYAHEALGAYDKAAFFDAADRAALADLMGRRLDGTLVTARHEARAVARPFAPDWNALVHMIAGEGRPA